MNQVVVNSQYTNGLFTSNNLIWICMSFLSICDQISQGISRSSKLLTTFGELLQHDAHPNIQQHHCFHFTSRHNLQYCNTCNYPAILETYVHTALFNNLELFFCDIPSKSTHISLELSFNTTDSSVEQSWIILQLLLLRYSICYHN